jgi:hypothetical protein
MFYTDEGIDILISDIDRLTTEHAHFEHSHVCGAWTPR